jgi:hypothetical protein
MAVILDKFVKAVLLVCAFAGLFIDITMNPLPRVISFTKLLPACLSSPHPPEVKIKCIFSLYSLG